MAEFLVMNEDHTNPDPIKDARGCYKRGDIVEVYEDGRCKEPPAPGSPYIIIKVPGVMRAQVTQYMDMNGEDTILNGIPTKKILTRRIHQIKLDSITSADKKVDSGNMMTIDPDKAIKFIKNKVTGKDETKWLQP